jgi:hypothetical protein
MLMIRATARRYSSAGTEDEDKQKAENIFVARHIAKPNVSGSCFRLEVIAGISPPFCI